MAVVGPMEPQVIERPDGQRGGVLRVVAVAVTVLSFIALTCRAEGPGGLNSVTQGMSRAEVVGIMGRSSGAMRLGGRDILIFGDGEVELAADKVVSVKRYAAKAPPPAPAPVSAPAAPKSAATNTPAPPAGPARQGPQVAGIPATMAHEILRLEARFGANQKDEGALNALLVRAKKALPQAKANADGQEARKCLEAIQTFLKKEGFEYRPTAFLFEALRARKSDCDTTVLIYCAIGEAVDYPLGAVVLPRHAFVRWTLPHGNVVNWETTETNRNASFSDGSYYEWLLKGMTGEGCNLKKLTRQQLPAIHHYMAGLAFATAGRFDEAIKEHDAALKLDQNWYLSRLEKSGVCILKESYADGATESLKAMEYLPVDELGQLTSAAVALALLAKQDAQVDRKQLGRIVRGFMRPDSDSAGYIMLNAMDAYLDDRGSSALADMDGVCGKWPTNFVPYLCRGAMRSRNGDALGAARDGQEALRLMKANGVTRQIPQLQR